MGRWEDQENIGIGNCDHVFPPTGEDLLGDLILSKDKIMPLALPKIPCEEL